ncbi:MAG TPA: protein-disulfide reductase DsbD domain-containing protein [Stellaceae bacterium]|nr:protein-disulfide reductase DsbD domain-containing protein [Stellaceae bacterium]
MVLFTLAGWALAAGSAAAAPPPASDLVKLALYGESATVAPGGTLWTDLHLRVAPGWHIYWKNPGDSGLPTEIDWALPPGFSAGAIEWPVPEQFLQGGIGNYGYAGSTDLVVPIAAPTGLAADAQPHLAATVKYLVCSEICIPGEAQVALDPAVGPGSPDPAEAARFAAARRALPVAAPFAAQFAVGKSTLRLIVPASALGSIGNPTGEFFPNADNAIDHSAAEKTERRNGGLQIVLAKATGPTAAVPKTLDGVLALRGADGSTRGYLISATQTAAAPAEAEGSIGAWQALLFAFVGGLILNLMPCVFPILSLKVLGFAAADAERRHHHGLAYAAGVVLSFAALGGALIALRAGGAAIGWGFQLQSPLVVGLLAYLMLAMGLSLSGVAEIGGGIAGIGGGLAGRQGLAGAFFTGVLATVVATPCTAPFMGAALGLALVEPAPLALAIFVALGAGMAAPLLAASFVPGVARLLPRPGAWMATLKQVLAFLLYATAAWLVWVLIQEVGPEGSLMALIGLVLVGFAVWVYGRTRFVATGPRRLGIGLAGAGLAAAIVLAAMLTPSTGKAPLASDGLAYEAFTPARLAALTAERKPVFVNLTAAWCLTCIVNERATLDRDAVRTAFAAHHVVALKGDWTRQDPEIARFLQSFGRSGVPLYLLYDGDGTATVLPQILTEAEVIGAVDKL